MHFGASFGYGGTGQSEAACQPSSKLPEQVSLMR